MAHLPELVQGGTPEAESVRHDWGLTLSDLVRDNYLRPMAEYAAAHATRFRSQTYGEPAVTLADEHIPQLPEGEGPQWHAFSFTRWASSANHVYGNRITSAETFTWLHSPAFRATPLDMKAEADCMFLEGVNQIIGHGFPYSAPGVEEPGWSLYAAAALNDHNPWWPVMHDVTAYLQRVSWALRQGEPANDVALLLPEDDAQAEFRPGHVSVTDEMKQKITPDLMGAILDSGYNVDYIDLAAIEQRGLHYPMVVVPPTERMPLRGVRALEAYVAGGGKLIFLGRRPRLPLVWLMLQTLRPSRRASSNCCRRAVTSKARQNLRRRFRACCSRMLNWEQPEGRLGSCTGTSRMQTSTSLRTLQPSPCRFRLRVRSPHHEAEWWDADTGKVERAELGQSLTLPPYGSRLLVLSESRPSNALRATQFVAAQRPAIKLSDWTVAFPGSAGSPAQPTEQHVEDTLWTDSEATRFYSGAVRYTTKFHLDSLHEWRAHSTSVRSG